MADPSPLPASIEAIPAPELRWQAARVWQACNDLLECSGAWQRWAERLTAESPKPGEASREAYAVHEKAGRAANSLCDARAVAEGITPVAILDQFPKPPMPLALSRGQYDVRREVLDVLDKLDRNLVPELLAIRTQTETCPEKLLTPVPDEWSKGRTRTQWAKLYGISETTFDNRRNDGTIAWRPFGKLIQVRSDSLPPEA